MPSMKSILWTAGIAAAVLALYHTNLLPGLKDAKKVESKNGGA